MPPRPRKPKSDTNEFANALAFVGTVCSKVGPVNETHFHIVNNQVTAFNGILAAGHTITEDLIACPHAHLLVEATLKCGQNFSITQLEGKLSIKSDKFKAIIPCLSNDALIATTPDQPIAIINDRFKTACAAVAGLANENAQQIALASIFMNGQSLISTDSHLLIEYWHGIDLPPGLVIPKPLCQLLQKIPKKLARFGFSASTVTFYFEDGSWIRSQLFADPWPDVQGILNQPCNPWPVPVALWDAIAAIQPFADALVYFDRDVLRSHSSEHQGASYDCSGLPRGPIFSIKQLLTIKPYIEKVDWLVNNGQLALWYGANCRGAIAGRI